MRSDSIAQQQFDAVVQSVALELKKIGYGKSRYIFRKVVCGNLAVIEFQKSMSSTSETILFTVNLGVVSKQLSEVSWGPPFKMRSTSSCHLQERLGYFLAEKRDKWWEVKATTDAKKLGDQVLALILDHAVPYIELNCNIENLIRLWESGESPGLTDGQRQEFLTILRPN
jgi:Domain of unknown function (DUF4304)